MTFALARQLGALQTSRAAEVEIGVVQAVETGPPKTVTVTIGGSAHNTPGVRYGSWYTPTVGDTVVLLVLGSDSRARQSWVCIGTLA